jgi:hypothetical protein
VVHLLMRVVNKLVPKQERKTRENAQDSRAIYSSSCNNRRAKPLKPSRFYDERTSSTERVEKSEAEKMLMKSGALVVLMCTGVGAFHLSVVPLGARVGQDVRACGFGPGSTVRQPLQYPLQIPCIIVCIVHVCVYVPLKWLCIRSLAHTHIDTKTFTHTRIDRR